MLKELKHKFVMTEKTTFLREQNKIVLLTNRLSNQKDVVAFIEAKYEAKVLKINSMNMNGKKRVRKGHRITLPDRKKFYLTLDNLSKFE